MTDCFLSSQQITVIGALSSGASITHAAAEAGVHRNTIANWRRNHLPFQYALLHAQYDRALYYREKIEEQADRAVETIAQILGDPHAPASVRLRAALAVLNTAAVPPEPKKQVQLDIEKIVVQQKEPEIVNEPEPEPAAHNPSNLHNSAQTPYCRATPKIGRNEPCPCGSGRKFKHCCIHKPNAAAA